MAERYDSLWVIEVGNFGNWTLYQKAPFLSERLANEFVRGCKSNEASVLEYRVVEYVRIGGN